MADGSEPIVYWLTGAIQGGQLDSSGVTGANWRAGRTIRANRMMVG